MKKILWKVYMDYEKEEKWLNEMSARGLAFTNNIWCCYTFEECEPGAYIYRLELLNDLPGHPESKRYIRFMEDNGVEHVTSYFRWVYFRKKAADGAFDIYSDIDSRIRHYKRILALWIPLCCLEIAIGASNLIIGLSNSPLNLGAAILLFVIGAIIFYQCLKVRRKLGELQKEKKLRE